MKILLINQTFYPEQLATSQQVTDLAKFLVGAGHEVLVLTGRRGYEERSKIFTKSELWEKIKIKRVHSTGFGKSRVYRRVLDSLTFDLALLWELIKTPKQDLTVCFTSPPLLGIFGVFFKLLKGGRCAQWLMDVNPDAAFAVGYVDRKSLIGKFLNAVFEFTVRKSDHLIVLDRWMKERILNHGANPEGISIIPPWSVIEKEEHTPTGVFREKCNLERKFIVLYSGNHSVVHPLDTLLRAAKALKNEDRIRFVFSGSGLRTLDVKRFVEENQLSNVIQLPWQPREILRDSFRSVDLHCIVMGNAVSGLVHLSKLYSVLASGRPFLFIGPKESHVVDLINDSHFGDFVQHGEVEKLTNKILNEFHNSDKKGLSINSDQQKYLADHYGRDRSLGVFNSEVVAKVSASGLEPNATLISNSLKG